MKPQVRCPNCGKVLEAPEAPAPAIPTRRAMLTPEGRFLGEYDAARQVVILRYRGRIMSSPCWNAISGRAVWLVVVKSCDIIGVERRNRRGMFPRACFLLSGGDP